MTDSGYALDRLTPARHVATELDRAAPAALSLADLVASYRHPNTGDLARVAQHEHVADPLEWLVRDAIGSLTFQVVEEAGSFRLADGVAFSDLRFEGKQLAGLRNDHAQFGAPFDPMTGRFAENVRTDKLAAAKDGMEELRESLRALGWVPEFPALQDKRGIFLTGHRRLKAAAELRAEGLDIQDQIRVLDDLGDGDEHDARRLRIALASNVGFKPLSPTDRKAIAESLYADGWVMERIGEALQVSTKQVSNDLRGFEPTSKPHRPKGGRPKGTSKRGTKMTREQVVQLYDLYFVKGIRSREELAERIGAGQSQVKDEITRETARRDAARKALAERDAERERSRAAMAVPVTPHPEQESTPEPGSVPVGHPMAPAGSVCRYCGEIQ